MGRVTAPPSFVKRLGIMPGDGQRIVSQCDNRPYCILYMCACEYSFEQDGGVMSL